MEDIDIYLDGDDATLACAGEDMTQLLKDVLCMSSVMRQALCSSADSVCARVPLPDGVLGAWLHGLDA